MVHLDTNFLAMALVPGTVEEAKVENWLRGQEQLGISTIAWAEFLSGPLSSEAAAAASRLFASPEPFLPVDAEAAANLFNQTGRRSRSLADCMIAAVALRCGATLATSNVDDFRPLQQFGLLLA